MTELDAEIGPLAVELISEFGKSITLSTVFQGAYNPATGAATKVTAMRIIKAIVEEYKGSDFASGLIEGGDKKVTIAAQGLDTKPSPSDKLSIDGVDYAVQAVKTIYSGELPAIYEIQAR